MLDLKTQKLDNNLRIMTAPIESTQAVTVMVLVNAGSRYERKEKNGLAHFLEHMFFKGGDRYPTQKAVAEAVDGVGGEFNAFTTTEYVGYYVKVAKQHTDTAFDVLSDMMLNTNFEKEDVEKEKGVILEEYNMYLDSPRQLISDKFKEILFGDQPIGWPVLGQKQAITQMQKEDFAEYKDHLYRPDNIVVAVSGDITEDEARDKVEDFFKYGKEKTEAEKKKPEIPEADEPSVLIHEKDTDQAHLALGLPAISGSDERKFVLKVLSALLGGSMSSRLFQTIRERLGLAYYVSSTAATYSDTGYLATYSGVSLDGLEKALSNIKQEYEKLVNDPVPQDELDKAKELIKGRLILSLEDSDGVAHSYGLQELLYGRLRPPEKQIERIDEVTAEEIQELMQEIYSPERLNLALIGPYEENKEQDLKELLANS